MTPQCLERSHHPSAGFWCHSCFPGESPLARGSRRPHSHSRAGASQSVQHLFWLYKKLGGSWDLQPSLPGDVPRVQNENKSWDTESLLCAPKELPFWEGWWAAVGFEGHTCREHKIVLSWGLRRLGNLPSTSWPADPLGLPSSTYLTYDRGQHQISPYSGSLGARFTQGIP
jgi:hypothetical protein